MKTRASIYCRIFLALIGSWASPLMAQSEPESGDGSLLLQSQRETIEIPVGSYIDVNYRHDSRIYRGEHLQAVMDSTVVLSGDTVQIKYIDRIAVKREKLHKAGKITLFSSIGAVLLFWFLVACLFAFYLNPALMFITGLLLVLVAIPASLAMPTGIIVGIVLLAVSTKIFQLGYNWKLSTRPKKSNLPSDPKK